ncbi:hypothetical protein GCM10009087_14210 [Sphingomonas oligophenolica]|uniref:Lipoprotein n=1 Tax=Sphingomonas oligophenolica TaxID=301154 RepID=A0ABU9Y2P1_9SPHN
MRGILPAGLVLAPLLALAACSTPEQMTRAGLESAGIPKPMAGCMAHRMVDRLSLLQLRRLAGLGKAGESKSVDQFLYRVRSLNDSKIVGVTTSSAALCALGVG